MPWKYSVFTVMCPEYDLQDTAALASQVGLNGLEWRVNRRPPEPIESVDYWRNNRSTVDIDDLDAEIARAKQIADSHGLEMPILGTYMRCDEAELVERVMRAAAAVGCRKMRVGPPLYDGSRPYPALFDETVAAFRKIAALARKHGVQACVEMHMGNITPSAGLAHRLVSNFDAAEVGVIFDPGNTVVEGYESLRMAVELLGPYLSHVHAKNCLWVQTGEEDGAAKWEWRMAAVKAGQADWKQIVTTLKEVGYEGWLSFEDFSEGETRHKLSEGLAYLRQLEAGVG